MFTKTDILLYQLCPHRHMKVEILTKSLCKEILKEETSHKFSYMYQELTRFRNRIQEIEEEIKILKNKN